MVAATKVDPRLGRALIELKGVSKAFGPVRALNDVSLAVAESEFFCLLGPSGCGKSTLLRIIAGLEQPTTGSIVIAGSDMTRVMANRRPTNMVFQNYAIFPHLSVHDNVGFGLRRLKLAATERVKRVEEALEMVDLNGLGQRKSSELSGGQRQRVALARALILRPRVLLLDEPLSALDKRLRESMQFELRRLQRSIGVTFIMVTHDQYEAMTMADRIGVMFDGRLAETGTPSQLYRRPVSRDVARFFGGMNVLPAHSPPSAASNSAVITLPAFGALNVECSKIWAGVSEVGLRPEQAEIYPCDQHTAFGEYLHAHGAVLEVAFYGESIHYHVALEGLREPFIVAMTNYFERDQHQVGDRVGVRFHPEAVIALHDA